MTQVGSFAARAEHVARLTILNVGLSPENLEVLRIGDRAVFRQNQAKVIVRVERSMQRLEAARREVKVARWLERSGINAQRPYNGNQPEIVAGLPVSLWHAVEGNFVTLTDLAMVLRHMHELEPPADFALPPLDPFPQAYRRISDAPAISEDERTVLQTVAENLRNTFNELVYVLNSAVLHGDANRTNALRTRDGTIVFLDLPRVCVGPREWDLVGAAVGRQLGWHTAEQYAAFCERYGFDVTSWAGYGVLSQVQALRMTCWLAQKAGDSREIAEEVSRRIADLADPDRPRRWQPR
jgi:Ser/Thr protein kinase RdoA (MazF antagonist)